MSSEISDQYRASLWPMPAAGNTADGQARRVGVELEFSGLDIDEIAAAVSAELGGQARIISPYEQSVEETCLGEFGLELDYAYLKRLGRERGEDTGDDGADHIGESLLKLLAEQLVPYEIVGPPIPMAELWRLGDLLVRLRRQGAKGTNHATIYAFGLHLNPELPALDAATVLAYLRAFLCLYEWLLARSRVNLSRRITPYIDPFPRDYVKQLLKPDYEPDQHGLIADYLKANPTRNRALDMLPLFAHLDEEQVRAAVADPRISARPTLHYRLPNCQIDEPGWSLAQPWRDWLQVEALALDAERLKEAQAAYLAHLEGPAGGLFSDWVTASSRWLLPELL